MKRLLFLGLLTFISVWAVAQNKSYMQQLDEKYTSALFRGNNAHILVPMNDPAATSSSTVLQYLQGRVPGLMIFGSSTLNPVVVYRMGRPALFLDEVRVDASLLSSINLDDVALIKIFRPPFFGALGGGSGAVAVYTKKGDEEE